MEFVSRPVIAIGLFVFAMALIPLNDALIKLLSDRISIFEIMGVRAAFSCAMLALFPLTIPSLLRMSFSALVKLSIRGFCLVGAMLMFFLPLSVLTLAEVTAIFYTAPLIISVLSVPILGEKLGIYRIMAVVAGIIGTLIIVQPGGEQFQFAYLMPVCSALSYSAFQLVTRYLKNETELMAMVAVQNLIYLFTGFLGVALIAIFKPPVPSGDIWGFLLRPWTTPTIGELAILGIASIAVLSLSLASTNVYRSVEATIVAPFEYTALPMAVIWGVVFWGDWPDPAAWAGMILIFAAGLFMIYRENRKNTDISSAVPMRSSATNVVTLDESRAKTAYDPLPICF